MNNQIVFELQRIYSKLTNNACLTPADVQTLDRAKTEAPNLTESIYRLIADPTNPFFYVLLDTIKPYPNMHQQILSLIEARLQENWNYLDQRHKDELDYYLNKQTQKANEADANILIHLNKILVLIARLEWQSVYQKLVNSLKSDKTYLSLSDHIPLEKFRNFLETGLQTIKKLFSPLELQQFSNKFNKGMRNVINMLGSSLNHQEDQFVKVNILNFLTHVINRASHFQLITTELIQQLAMLIGKPECRQSLVMFYQKIFKMKQITDPGSKKEYQIKNLLRLVRILQAYLQQCQENVHESLSFWRTKDLLNLLFVFLPRYLSYAVKITVWGIKDLQLDHPVSHFYSSEFSTFIGQIYWRLVKFLLSTIVKLDICQKLQKDLSFQYKKKFLCCSRLLLSIRSQLPLNGLTVAEQYLIQVMIYQCIHTCTPINSQFLHFYGGQYLQKEKNAQSQDYKEEYSKFIKTVLVGQMYRSYFLKLLTDSTFLRRDMHVEMTKEQAEGVMSTLNARIWSHISAYRIDSNAIKDLANFNMFKILSQYKMQNNKRLQTCVQAKSFFLLQIFYPCNSSFQTIMQNFGINSEVTQYLLVTLSKIFVRNQAAAIVGFDDLRLIIQHLHQLEELTIKKDKIIKVYPAIIRLLVEKLKKESIQVQSILRDLIGNEIENLPQTIKIDQRTDCSEPRQLYLFKRLEQISHLLIKEFGQSESTAKIKLPFDAISIVDQMRTMIATIITKLNLKRLHFGKLIREAEQEDIELLDLIQFRSLYVEVSRCYIVMSCLERNSQDPFENNRKGYIMKINTRQKLEFASQTHFRYKDYLLLALEFYRWAKKHSYRFSQKINSSVSSITECFIGWEGECKVSKEQVNFWKEVIVIIGQKLDGKNSEYLYKLYDIFPASNILGTIIEPIIELSYQLMKAQRPPFQPLKFDMLRRLFIATFSTLFQKEAQDEYIFDRIFNQIYYQLKICGLQFAKHWIEQNIPQASQLKENKEHQQLLNKALTDGDLALREYIFFIKRTKVKLF